MSARKSINRFLEVREEFPDSYAMWHARIATHGVQNESNCHPFMVGDNGLTYLAHNGILDVPMDRDEKRSDSRIFAEETLPKMGGVHALDDDVIYTMVRSWAQGSKMCVLSVDPEADCNAYIINESSGKWDENRVWWSNDYHRTDYAKILTAYVDDYDNENRFLGAGKRSSSWGSYHGTGYYSGRPAVLGSVSELGLIVLNEKDDYGEEKIEYEEEWATCSFCHKEESVIESYCYNCTRCADCGFLQDDCLCYIPGSASSQQDYGDPSWGHQFNY